MEEMPGHEFHKAVVGHGIWKEVCKVLADEKQIVALEVAE
jgi:hypothetical protein